MAVTLQHPGVFINEVLGKTTTSTGPNANAAGAFIATTNRGPLTPVLCQSWSDFTTAFGGYSGLPPTSTGTVIFGSGAYGSGVFGDNDVASVDTTAQDTLADAVNSAFSNGAGQLYIVRVAPSDAVSASGAFKDNGSSGGANTLTFTAANPGVWGNKLYVDINAHTLTGPVFNGRFDVNIRYGSAAAAIVERFNDLSIVTTDPRYFARIINSGSSYVSVVDDASTNTFPANTPKTVSGVALASGADGTASITYTSYVAALTLLAPVSQPLVLNLPGVTDPTILNPILQAAEAAADVWVVCDLPKGETSSTATSDAATLYATSYGAAWAPWIQINDPSTSIPGVTKLIPPGGAIVGQILSTDSSTGPFQTPAGVTNRLTNAIGLETAWSSTDLDTLTVATPPVNAIRNLPGYGICLWGARTLKAGYPDKYIAIRRSLIYLEQSLNNLTKFAVFQPNDSSLWDQLTVRVTNFLNAYWSLGGLQGTSAQQAFYVTCDSTNNTLNSIQNGTVNIEVGVALQYPAEFIVITLTQYQGGSTATTA